MVINSDIRSAIKLEREKLKLHDVITLSNDVFSNLKLLDFLWEKQNYFVYNSFNNEVKTNKIIQELLLKNKTVAMPVIKGSNMVAGIPTGELVKDIFGVLSPKTYTVLEDIDVAIIPLLACDNNKNRMGYGKGYYDKFLSSHPCLKVGVCYDFQVVPKLSPAPWDVPLDIIVTPTRIIK